MKETENLKLPIIPESEYTTTKVIDMIKANQGDSPDSAFNIIDTAIAGKQDTLQSGTNIKTINNQSILGSGNIEITVEDVPVKDVKVNGESVVENEVANIILPDSVWEPGTGTHSIQSKGTGCDARGAYSVAEGNGTLAESDLSHAEGWATRTIIDDSDLDTHGHASHAEGSHTIAKGACSHAEGNTTESMGMYSHAEGSGTISGGRSSHAEGDGTITENVAEHAEGSYNKSHSIKNGDSANTLHSIGIGTSMNDRKNAVEIMQNGDQYILGIGDYDGTETEDAQSLQEVIAFYKDWYDKSHDFIQDLMDESSKADFGITDVMKVN